MEISSKCKEKASNSKKKRFKKSQVHISNNDKIHPKCLYFDNPPDFNKLAIKCPELKKHLFTNKYGTVVIDWKNTSSLKELTKALLKCDFKVDYWDIPNNFLIPCITSKCNYIHWIDDLLTSYKVTTKTEYIDFPCDEVIGIDIGVGANCIYPLLGNSIFGWRFLGSDVNLEALVTANTIVQRNNLEESIKLAHQEDSSKIFHGIIDSDDFFYFSMSNPPYYTYEEEKNINPAKGCEYNNHEMFCEGGEFEFISNMIEESESYKFNVLWFTSLIGKKSSLKSLKLKFNNSGNFKKVIYTEFYQGKQVRWGVAWTFFSVADFEYLRTKLKSSKNQVMVIQQQPSNDDTKLLSKDSSLSNPNLCENSYTSDQAKVLHINQAKSLFSDDDEDEIQELSKAKKKAKALAMKHLPR